MENKTNIQDTQNQNRDVMYQVSLLQSLAYGDYCGSVTVKELKQHGDVGIGTFHGLNGELILLDGTAYRAAGDGSVEAVSDEETIPFSAQEEGIRVEGFLGTPQLVRPNRNFEFFFFVLCTYKRLNNSCCNKVFLD